MLSSNAHQGAPKDVKFESLEEMNQDLGANGQVCSVFTLASSSNNMLVSPSQSLTTRPQYGRSKLANLLYARYLAKTLSASNPHILINAVHPGVVSTKQSTQDIHEPFPILGYGVSTVLEPFKKSQFEGCVSAMFAATVIQQGGEYVCPPAVIEEGSELSRDEELGERLMRFTVELVEEKTKAKEKGCPLMLAEV